MHKQTAPDYKDIVAILREKFVTTPGYKGKDNPSRFAREAGVAPYGIVTLIDPKRTRRPKTAFFKKVVAEAYRRGWLQLPRTEGKIVSTENAKDTEKRDLPPKGSKTEMTAVHRFRTIHAVMALPDLSESAKIETLSALFAN